MLAAGILREHDLPMILAAIERADVFGPLLDPTLWRDKHRAMEEDRDMLRAAMPLWELGKRLATTRERTA